MLDSQKWAITNPVGKVGGREVFYDAVSLNLQKQEQEQGLIQNI